MICRNCHLDLLSRLSFRTSLAARSRSPPQCTLALAQRNYSTPSTPSSTPTSTSTAPASQPSPSSSTTAAPAASTKGTKESSDKKPSKSAPKVTSSVPAGKPLRGLNYNKDEPSVLALDDQEYPPWLWNLLDKPKDKAGSGVDTSTMNAHQRKRHEKKMAARAAAMPKVIPLHEQSTDITPAGAVPDDGVVTENPELAASVMKSTRDITKSAREARRKKIKQDNFLRGM